MEGKGYKIEGPDNEINLVEMKAVEKHEKGTQIFELERIDKELEKLESEKNAIFQSFKKLTSNELFSDISTNHNKMYELEILILDKLKEKRNLIEGLDKHKIKQNQESVEIENVFHERELNDDMSIISRIEKLKNRILLLKDEKPKTIVDAEIIKKKIEWINEDINQLTLLN